MAHIREVTVNFGATVNLGNYESMRLDVQVRADIDQGDLDSGGVNSLLETAQHEIAFGLFELAETKLRNVKWREDALMEDHMERAVSASPEFRWINKLHPELAADLLANVLADAFPIELPQAVAGEAVEDDAAADIYDPIQHLRMMAEDKAVTKAQFNEALRRYFDVNTPPPNPLPASRVTPPPTPLPASREGEQSPEFDLLDEDEAARMEADAAAAQDAEYEKEVVRVLAAKAAVNGTEATTADGDIPF